MIIEEEDIEHFAAKIKCTVMKVDMKVQVIAMTMEMAVAIDMRTMTTTAQTTEQEADTGEALYDDSLGVRCNL